MEINTWHKSTHNFNDGVAYDSTILFVFYVVGGIFLFCHRLHHLFRLPFHCNIILYWIEFSDERLLYSYGAHIFKLIETIKPTLHHKSVCLCVVRFAPIPFDCNIYNTNKTYILVRFQALYCSGLFFFSTSFGVSTKGKKKNYGYGKSTWQKNQCMCGRVKSNQQNKTMRF